ncbi:MAG TPA: menaquinone biosynthesis protein, partial [Thermotogota bacterium]|nr:menaquinone biosynthesis protein [Thermotogota bacterium]
MKDLTPLRVGKIRYLNCLPFYFTLQEKLKAKGLDAVFVESHPADLNRALQSGEIDLGPVSSFEYLARQDQYLLLPDLGIGAGDFARSVILFSRVKLQDLDGATIALSEESASSAAMLRIMLKGRYGFENRFETVVQDPGRVLRKYPAALLIGDAALYFESEDWFYKYDLGEMWREWTKSPFVFALWTVRKTAATERAREIAVFLEVLKENLRKNMEVPEELLKHALGMTPVEKRFAQTLGYLVNLRFELDKAMTDGLLKFFELAHREELAPAPKPLEFFHAA